MLLGSSGGNNTDYDMRGNQIVDCCSGTLGSLVQDASKREYLLGNNHVLAKSDHASVGDTIVQPGLIDNNCTPFGDDAGPATGIFRGPGGSAHRLAAALFKADQRRRGDCSGDLARR